MFKKYGKIYYANAYYDVIDGFIAIYNVVEMSSNIIHFPVIYFLTLISFIQLQFHKWRLYVEDRWRYFIL